MNIADIKARVKEALSKNLWFMIGVYIVYSILMGLTSYIIVGILLTGVLVFGYNVIELRTLRGEEKAVSNLFYGFDKDFVRTCIAGLLISIFTFLWALLFIIPGIVKAYSYSMTYYIMIDDENVGANDAITKSREMMNGHKMELFVQDLSFIGWILLSFFTFGILLFWVMPYMNLARAEFYRRLKGEEGVVVEVVENPSDNESADSQF